MDEISSRPCSLAMDYATADYYDDDEASVYHSAEGWSSVVKQPKQSSRLTNLGYSLENFAPTGQQQASTSLPDLPSELIDHILCYLSPVDLASVCLVNSVLHFHAMADHLWQNIVQSNVPGVKLTTSYPCASFRELYIAHDPHWFLTKYKIWFSDRDLTGKLIIAGYDQRRGVIEGYQLLANSTTSDTETNHSPSLMTDTDVEIHDFEPEVKLHLDKPVLQMRANSLENMIRATARQSSSTSTPNSFSSMTSWVASKGTEDPAISSSATRATSPIPHRFAAETPMPMDGQNETIFNTFMLARGFPDSSIDEGRRLPFPYNTVWPPPAFPASERVSSAHHMRDGMDLMAPEERPSRRSEISEKSFRIRSWMEMRPAGLRGVSMGWLGQTLLGGNNSDWSLVDSGTGLFGQASRPWPTSFYPSSRTHIGEQVTTYSTLEPELYTPTPDQPWKGIWVGDYSAHGCEFLLIKQTHPGDFDEAAFESTRTEEETEEEFQQRKADARRYRGRLEAIKLTGDPNVPRGECTFAADDLGPDGYVTTVEEQPFKGARVVHSKGHIARTGFTNGEFRTQYHVGVSPD